MMCTVCGTTLKDGAKFCGTCGKNVSAKRAGNGQTSLKVLAYQSACRRYGQSLSVRPRMHAAPMFRVA